MPESFKHDYADLGDVRLHYVAMGEGPAVVLLHGWPQTWYMWRDVMRGLATRYRAIAPDLRGLGDSSRPASNYDKKTIAEDIWRLTHEVLGEDRFFLVGHDWGGPRPSPWLRNIGTRSGGWRFSMCRCPETVRP